MADPSPDIKNPIILWFAFLVTLGVQCFAGIQAYRRWRSSPPITREEFDKFKKDMESQRMADQGLTLAGQQVLAKELGAKIDAMNSAIAAHVGEFKAEARSLAEIREVLLGIVRDKLSGE